MINLKYTYQPSKNLDEVNKQVTNLVELLKNELLQAATNENVESLVMKVEQTSDDGAKRLAEVNARVGGTAAIVGMMASYNSATGKITVEAGLKAGIEESNIVLSGDHIILDGDVTINSGFKLSGSHITAGTITANEIAAYTITSAEIASGAITADKIDAGAISVQTLVNNYGDTIIFGDGIKIPTSPGSSEYCTYINNSAIYTKQIMAERILCTKISSGSTPAQLFTSYLSSFSGEDLYIYGLTRVQNGLKVSDHLESFGTTYLNGTVYSHGIKQAGSGTGTANVFIHPDTDLMQMTGGSSRRFKHDIKPIENKDLDIHRLYDIPVVQFVYNDDYLDPADQRYQDEIPGFIAEDIKEAYPVACEIDKEGQVTDWNERFIIPPMLALIQEQNQRIKRLEEAYVRDN